MSNGRVAGVSEDGRAFVLSRELFALRVDGVWSKNASLPVSEMYYDFSIVGEEAATALFNEATIALSD